MSLKRDLGVPLGLMLMVAAVLITPYSAQNCTEDEEECEVATTILTNFSGAVMEATNDADTEQLCQQFKRTSLSNDDNMATYEVQFRSSGCDDTPMKINATLEVESNDTIRVTYGDESEADIQTILYIDEGNCFVGRSNRTGQTLFLFRFIPVQEDDCTCLQKFKEYSGGNLTVLRDQRLCKNIPVDA